MYTICTHINIVYTLTYSKWCIYTTTYIHRTHPRQKHEPSCSNRREKCTFWSRYQVFLERIYIYIYIYIYIHWFQASILLIVQYKYSKSCSEDFMISGFDPPHKIMQCWFYSSTLLTCWFPLDQYDQAKCLVPVRYQIQKGKSAGLDLH